MTHPPLVPETSDQNTAVPFQSVQMRSQVFKISPLIRLALWTLYIALMLPVPFLAQLNSDLDIPIIGLGIALVSGGVLLEMALSERVCLNPDHISVSYPSWVLPPFRRGWSLKWSEVQAIKARSTGQGGLVYYLVSVQGDGYLLPMRIAGFQRLLTLIQAHTGIDTQDIKLLSQPWMYAMLLGAALMLAIADGWVLSLLWSGSGPASVL